MTDQRELDRLLDAFLIEGTDELADRVIDAALGEIDHTRQRRPLRLPRRLSTMNLPIRVAAAAVIGVLAVGATLYLGGLGQPAIGPPSHAVDPSSTPDRTAAAAASPTPRLATPSSSPEPCFTDTMTVLTGEPMRSATGAEVGEAMKGIGRGRGVYVGRIGPVRSGLWAVGPGDDPARPIAAVTPGPMLFDVLDLSADGTSALIRAGQLTINSPDPECVDLYAVQMDGSGATRLTPFRGGRSVYGAAFSPNGSHVAYSWWGHSGDNTITVLDVGSGQAVDQPCRLNFGFSPGRIEWSPSGDRIAILCYQTLMIFDAGGATEPVPFPTEDAVLFGWSDDRHLRVSTGGADIRSFDVGARISTSIGRFDVSDIELVTPSSGGFSPDGRWLAFLGGERGDVPGNDFTTVGYLVPTSGGRPTRILNENEAASTVTWSADGTALIAAHEADRRVDDMPVVTLGRLDPGTLRWSEIGPLPGGQGVWRIP